MPALKMRPIEALANPVRRYLVELLCVGEQTSGDLAQMCFDRFHISWGAVSRHLKTLTASGLTKTIRHGPVRFYLLEDDWLELLDADVDDLRTHWNAGADTRRLGWAEVLRDEILPRSVSSPKSSLRGSSTFTTAELGRGRSEWSDWQEAIWDFE